MKKLLIHFAKDRNSGEFRRIVRLDNDSNKILGSETIELVFLPLYMIRKTKEFYKSKIGTRIIVCPVRLPFVRFSFIARANRIIESICIRIVKAIYKPDIIWSETLSAGAPVIGITGFKVADFHGDVIDEASYQGASESTLALLAKWQQNILDVANVIVVQSEEMKRHIIDRYKADDKKVIIYHCGVNTDLFDYTQVDILQIKKNLGISESDIVFVYTGGDQPWQMLHKTLLIFREIQRMMPQCKFLILLQGDKEALLEYCKDNNITNVQILQNIAFKDVYKYLSLANFAWLLRENIQLNRVASPTKLGEYLACGQIVITTKVAHSWEWLPTEDIVLVNPEDYTNAAISVIQKLESVKDFTAEKIKMRELALNNLSSRKDTASLSTIGTLFRKTRK